MKYQTVKIIDMVGDKQRVILELNAPYIFRILMMDIKKQGIKRKGFSFKFESSTAKEEDRLFHILGPSIGSPFV